MLATGAPNSVVRLSEHLDGPGEAVFRHACRVGLEGIVSKRRDRPYVSGPSGDWLKIKCLHREPFVVVGFIPSPGALGGLGALVLARMEADALVYAGRVGTGFTEASARDVLQQLEPLRIDQPALIVPREVARLGVVWVRPERLVEVEHRGATADGLLRHPSFRGLLKDE